MSSLISLAYCLLLISPSLAWHKEQVLPWPVRNQKRPIDDKFIKFWKRKVLDKILTYDYDTWFSRFLEFPPSLKAPVGMELSCPVSPSRIIPRNVHRLRPGDIKILAAVGDSMTTAFGARSKSLVDLFVEFRDISWSIGGRGKLEQVTTLPNILKKYNPLVQGFSTRSTPVSKRKDRGSGNNFAKSGGTAESLSEQIEELISHIKESNRVGFKQDWKILTIFIGIQDLCLSCFDRDFAPHKFIKKVSHALEKVKEKLPRVLVNLVQLFDVTKFGVKSSRYCHAFLKVTCPCAAAGYRQRMSVSRTAREYSRLLKNLVNSPRFRDTQEFAVVLQPFLAETSLPRQENGGIDQSYFAPDCFHLSAKGHAAMATALWNSMMDPVGMKLKSWSGQETLSCPRPDFPFIFTKSNSREYNNHRQPMGVLLAQLGGHDDNKDSEHAGKIHATHFRIGLHKNVEGNKRESNDGAESEREVQQNALGIAIGSGLAIAVMAVGIVIVAVKRRRNRPLAVDVRDGMHNYNSLNNETSI